MDLDTIAVAGDDDGFVRITVDIDRARISHDERGLVNRYREQMRVGELLQRIAIASLLIALFRDRSSQLSSWS